MTEIKRKGARSTKDIPTNILAHLNRGKIQTVNLVEWLVFIKENTTMLELQNFVKILKEELVIRIFQIAIHKD